MASKKTKKRLNPAEKKIIARLNRVQGQLKGISRMIEKGENGQNISIQISAAVSGLQSLQTSYLKLRLIEETFNNMHDIMDKINM